MPFRALTFLRFLVLSLALQGSVLWAQDTPDLTRLPVLSEAKALAATDLPDQGFWLDVREPGLYTLALDGAGLLGLSDFETANGRSDGSDGQERLLSAGSAYQTGALNDLLLLPGHAYLIQIAATVPRRRCAAENQGHRPCSGADGNCHSGITPEAP